VLFVSVNQVLVRLCVCRYCGLSDPFIMRVVNAAILADRTEACVCGALQCAVRVCDPFGIICSDECYGFISPMTQLKREHSGTSRLTQDCKVLGCAGGMISGVDGSCAWRVQVVSF
jgi:hypothetical protein